MWSSLRDPLALAGEDHQGLCHLKPLIFLEFSSRAVLLFRHPLVQPARMQICGAPFFRPDVGFLVERRPAGNGTFDSRRNGGRILWLVSLASYEAAARTDSRARCARSVRRRTAIARTSRTPARRRRESRHGNRAAAFRRAAPAGR